MEKAETLIEINNLVTSFRIKDEYFPAVDNVSLKLGRNEILAIVGESGCGKSTLATSIIGLHNPNNTKLEGEINFEGRNLLKIGEEEYNKIRGNKIGMIFQDPLSALNPLMRIGDQIEEGMIYHTKLSKKEREERVLELLNHVGIKNAERIARQFPHELSGGMRQRVIIAIALSCKPEVIIADEPTTALDVTIQAQILDLINEIKKELNIAVILITHDLGVVAQTADRVIVMYAGEKLEEAPVRELFRNPKHPYTWGLLKSLPRLDMNSNERLTSIPGTPPDLLNPPKGDPFAARSEYAMKIDYERKPPMIDLGGGHFVKSWLYVKGAPKIEFLKDEKNDD